LKKRKEQKSEELSSIEELGGAIKRIQIQVDDGLEEEKEAFKYSDPQNMKLGNIEIKGCMASKYQSHKLWKMQESFK
jgi:hypothetical protein